MRKNRFLTPKINNSCISKTFNLANYCCSLLLQGKSSQNLELSNYNNLPSIIKEISVPLQIFTHYMICLQFYQLFRLNAADFTSGAGLRLYQRLVYLKTLILKLLPIQKKLQYQKNKLLKKGEKIKVREFRHREQQNGEFDHQYQGNQENLADQPQEQQQVQQQGIKQQNQEQDNLLYKPKLKSLLNKSKPATDLASLKTSKYVAPKQSAVLSSQEKLKRRQQRQEERRKAYLLRKFRGDIQQTDQALERDMLEGIDPKFKRRYEEKLRYEEENFTRLNDTKREKYLMKQAMKNRFNNSLNRQIDEIALIRELVEQQPENNNRRPISMSPSTKKASKPTKKKKIE